MPAIWFISPTRWSLLPSHIMSNGKLTLLLFFPCLIEHTSQHMTNCFLLVCLLFYPEEPLQSTNLSPAVLPLLHIPLLVVSVLGHVNCARGAQMRGRGSRKWQNIFHGCAHKIIMARDLLCQTDARCRVPIWLLFPQGNREASSFNHF